MGNLIARLGFSIARLGLSIARLGHHEFELERNFWELRETESRNFCELAETEQERETNLSELPESCLSVILSFLTPRDVCVLSAVSKLFRSAANSNTVWNIFLPPQCQQILSRAVTPVAFSSKRELYFRLSDSIHIDGGRKIFWLERSTARIGYMLSARELSIVWGNDQRYWRWVTRDDSRFDELASLLAVCWLEVRGQIDCRVLSAGAEYRVVFVLKFVQYAQGWNERPVKFSVTTPEGEERESEQRLMECQRRVNSGGWMEVAAGEFKVRSAVEDNEDDPSNVEFCMKEVVGGNWKGGLLIDGVRIEPKSL